MKTVNELVYEVFACCPDMESQFNQWVYSHYSQSLTLGMELNDLIRINESEILQWLSFKIKELY